jgi:tRNA A-37 threonylcarbamoyl transferase component Bud32
MSAAKLLPGIGGSGGDEAELQSSTRMKAVPDGDATSNHEEAASALMDASGDVDKHHGTERDRQRRAHQERMATRQKERESQQVKTIETYAEGAEVVDRAIETERDRQRKAFAQRLNTRMRTADIVKGGKSVSRREVEAATRIQASFRGHLIRKSLKEGDGGAKRGRKGIKPRKRKKKKPKSPAPTATLALTADGGDGEVREGVKKISTSRDLLNVKRIPTPDLTITQQEIDGLKEAAATKIQAGYRGYRVRRDTVPGPIKAARLVKEKAEAEAAARAKRVVEAAENAPASPPAKKKEGSKKQRKRRPKKDKHPDSGETKKTTLERQGSRFSSKGLEERSVVEECYEIGKKIGDGNFAEVKECVHRETKKMYALKVIDKSKTRGAKETRMIENEVNTMRAVKHPNCVRLYDVFDTEDELFLVMEMVKGGDLFDRIVEKQKYPESDAVRLVRNMATALHHLHSRNIIHRDLKPENLLVTQDKMGRDTLKLADFGLSMIVTKPLRTICGTPTYVAPEIISESPDGYGLQVDLWATGVIAYIMLCGFPPFSSASKNQKDLFRKIKLGRFSFPSPYWDGISEEAKDLIRNLLKVDPKERYTAEQLLAHPWISNTEEPSTDLR